MKTTMRRAMILGAVGLLGVGAIALAVPAVAGPGPSGGPAAAGRGPGPGPGPDWRGGEGMGPGMGPGMMSGTGQAGAPRTGTGLRDGSCGDPATAAAKGTLTAAQEETLAAMAQEEKVAQDLYAEFADRYEAVIFDRIGVAETRHLTAVRTLLDRYGLADPTADQPAGQFSDPAVQATFDRLLAQGGTGLAAALTVGREVEQADIDALRAAQDGLTAPDVQQLYHHLLTSSQHHLTAFQRWADR
jgi:hypothetical protein